MEVLDSLGKWKTWDTLSKSRSREEQRLLRRLVDLMVRRTFVTRSDESRDIDQRLSAWRTWNPAAGFFHFATKDVRYRSEDGQTSVETRIEGRTRRAPSPLKTEYRGGMRLPPARLTGEVPSLLLARRTWRTFGRQPITLTELATLLQLTWGVQGWVQVPGVGPHALKTSPSGGARHSIEVYVLARKVASLEPGLYHYHPDDHRLARVALIVGVRRHLQFGDQISPVVVHDLRELYGIGARDVVFNGERPPMLHRAGDDVLENDVARSALPRDACHKSLNQHAI
jgi:hypothetical protein